MSKGVLKVLAVEYLSGLWICGPTPSASSSWINASTWTRAIILKVTHNCATVATVIVSFSTKRIVHKISLNGLIWLIKSILYWKYTSILYKKTRSCVRSKILFYFADSICIALIWTKDLIKRFYLYLIALNENFTKAAMF